MFRRVNESGWWLLFICTITHVFVHVFTMMHTALIPVLMKDFSLTIYEAGLLVSIPQVISIMLSLPYGFITDRIDPRKLIALSLLLAGLSGLSASYSWNFITLLVSVSFIPLSSSIYHPPALKILSENFPGQRRGKVLGIHGAGGTTGVAIGPITLGLMLERFGWRPSYLIWCIPVLLSTLLAFTLPYRAEVKNMKNIKTVGDQTINENNSKKLTLKLKNIKHGYLLLILATGVNSLGQQALSTYMTAYLVSVRKLSEANASLLFGLSPFIGILGSLIGGYLGDKIGSEHWMTIAYVNTAFVYSAVWLGPSWTLTPFYLISGFFGGSTLGPSTTLVAKYSPRERRGLAYTIFMLFPSIIGSISPLIAAWLVEEYSFAGLFPFTVTLIILSAFILQTLPKEG
ncbi:MFS transporter [Candidatus Bathyarchaeota archaeon]|nr:MFS transporter [Candidatus Bathyarchaeota archaeon]